MEKNFGLLKKAAGAINNTPLPEAFLARMRAQMGEAYPAFAAAFARPAWRGVRANLIKINDLRKHLTEPDNFLSVPWCPEGLAFRADIKLGQTLEYLAGLYYLQEPSAMSAAAMLDAQPGERILDLCAAPGGKTTQIAGAMRRRGLLVANDASPARAQALLRNIERAGVRNAVITTEQPRKLAEHFGGFFDRVLVDAPCSGEGMFRRDADVIKAYTANKPEVCAALQADILRHAAVMVRPGGRLVYATCTFNSLENEETIAAFITAQKDIGVPFTLTDSKRIWPHIPYKDNDEPLGEGHFVAVMTRAGEDEREVAGDATEEAVYSSAGVPPTSVSPANTPLFNTFCHDYLRDGFLQDEAAGMSMIQHGQRLHLAPEALDLRRIRVARGGWHVGDIAKDRFIPSQGLAMGLRAADARYRADLSKKDAWRYTRGETLDTPLTFGNSEAKPWVLVCCGGHPLGWARRVHGRLKNALPTGWVR